MESISIFQISVHQIPSAIDYIHQYAGNVGYYFTSAQQSAIQSANTISALQSVLILMSLKTNWPTGGLTRNDFNMRIGQSKLKSGQLFVNSESTLLPV